MDSKYSPVYAYLLRDWLSSLWVFKLRTWVLYSYLHLRAPDLHSSVLHLPHCDVSHVFSVLVIVATLALAVGLYGNDLSHDGAAPLLATPPQLQARDAEATRILLQERRDAQGDEDAIQLFGEVVRNEWGKWSFMQMIVFKLLMNCLGLLKLMKMIADDGPWLSLMVDKSMIIDNRSAVGDDGRRFRIGNLE